MAATFETVERIQRIEEEKYRYGFVTEIEAESIWQCAACGKCPDRCPRGVRIIDVLTAARRIGSPFFFRWFFRSQGPIWPSFEWENATGSVIR